MCSVLCKLLFGRSQSSGCVVCWRAQGCLRGQWAQTHAHTYTSIHAYTHGWRGIKRVSAKLSPQDLEEILIAVISVCTHARGRAHTRTHTARYTCTFAHSWQVIRLSLPLQPWEKVVNLYIVSHQHQWHHFKSPLSLRERWGWMGHGWVLGSDGGEATVSIIHLSAFWESQRRECGLNQANSWFCLHHVWWCWVKHKQIVFQFVVQQ